MQPFKLEAEECWFAPIEDLHGRSNRLFGPEKGFLNFKFHLSPENGFTQTNVVWKVDGSAIAPALDSSTLAFLCEELLNQSANERNNGEENAAAVPRQA